MSGGARPVLPRSRWAVPVLRIGGWCEATSWGQGLTSLGDLTLFILESLRVVSDPLIILDRNVSICYADMGF